MRGFALLRTNEFTYDNFQMFGTFPTVPGHPGKSLYLARIPNRVKRLGISAFMRIGSGAHSIYLPSNATIAVSQGKED